MEFGYLPDHLAERMWREVSGILLKRGVLEIRVEVL
jgi:hypothetical protein